MHRTMLSISVVIVFAAVADAQRPDNGQGRPGGPPRGFGGPPGFHLMSALDTDKDGKISAREIDGAVAALLKLDKDKDGKLSREEIGWPPTFFGGGGRGRGGNPGFGGGGPPGFGGRGGGRPQRPDPEADAPSRTGEARANSRPKRTFFSAAQLTSLDRDKDGKITKEEIPARIQVLILSRVDSNKDGVIDKSELAKLAEAQKKQ